MSTIRPKPVLELHTKPSVWQALSDKLYMHGYMGGYFDTVTQDYIKDVLAQETLSNRVCADMFEALDYFQCIFQDGQHKKKKELLELQQLTAIRADTTKQLREKFWNIKYQTKQFRRKHY